MKRVTGLVDHTIEELIALSDHVVVNETMHKDDKPVLLKYLKKRIKKLEGVNNDN